MEFNGIQWNGMRTGMRTGMRVGILWSVRDTLECVVGSVGRVWWEVLGECGGKRCAENRETCCNNRNFYLGNDFNYQLINDHVSLDQWLSIVDPMPEARVRFSPSTETK